MTEYGFIFYESELQTEIWLSYIFILEYNTVCRASTLYMYYLFILYSF